MEQGSRWSRSVGPSPSGRWVVAPLPGARAGCLGPCLEGCAPILFRPKISSSAARAAKQAAEANADCGLTLAIDIGSSSVRCAAYTPDAEAVAGSGVHLKLFALDPATGRADAGALVSAVDEAVGKCMGLLRKVGLAKLVRSIGFSTFVMNLVGTDGLGRAVTPVYTYADQHKQSAMHARALRRELEAAGELDAVWQRTGTPIHTAYAPAQFRRLCLDEPDILKQVACWQTISSLVIAQWLGVPHMPISFCEASWTGLLDFRALQWDTALLERVGVGANTLPELADYSEHRTGLCKAYASRWPELVQARIHLGIGDGAAANVGSGCDSGSSRIAVTIGTSAAARVILEHEGGAVPLSSNGQSMVPPGLWCYRVDRRRVLLGGALTDGGSVWQWLQLVARFGESRALDAALLAEVADLKPDAHGLTVLPFLSGERAPGWEPEAQATITGITRRTTAAHLVRAGLESVALRLAAVLERMGPHVAPEAVIVGSGEALRAASLWQQAVADASGREVLMDLESELTSRGVAVLLLQARGVDTAGSLPRRSHRRVQPDLAAAAAYLAARARQEVLYKQLYEKPDRPLQNMRSAILVT